MTNIVLQKLLLGKEGVVRTVSETMNSLGPDPTIDTKLEYYPPTAPEVSLGNG